MTLSRAVTLYTGRDTGSRPWVCVNPLMNIWEWYSHKEIYIAFRVKFQYQKDWGFVLISLTYYIQKRGIKR